MYRRKRRRNYRAQRPYQITRYRIPNVLNPDELIMKIKFNDIVSIDPANATTRIIYPVNGSRLSELTRTTNFASNAAKFRQVEFLSGKLSFYIINQGFGRLSSLGIPSYLMIGMHTIRRWYDEDLTAQTETVISQPTNFNNMWQGSSETQGYSIRLVNTITSGKGIQKLAFKGSKSSFKTLKANPTGFQENLPLPTTDPDRVFPANSMEAHVDLCFISDGNAATETAQNTVVLVSRTILVRFKGARNYV